MKNCRSSLWLWFFSAFFSFCFVFSFTLTNTHFPALLYFIALFLVLFISGKCLLNLSIFNKIASPPKFRIWHFAIMLLICWSPYFYILFPGSVSTDSVTQMKSLIGVVPLTNANPIFQTFLVGLSMFLGKLFNNMDYGILIYTATQAICMAILLAYTLQFFLNAGVKTVFVYNCFVFFAFLPHFPLYALCVGKDTNFAMCILLFVLVLYKLLYSPKKISIYSIIILSLISIMCMLLRNVGILLVSFSLLSFIVYFIIKKNRLASFATSIALLSTLTCYVLLHLLILPQFNVAPSPTSENYSVPVQQVARIAKEHNFNKKTHPELDALLPIEELVANYEPELSDPIKNLYNLHISKNEEGDFFSIWKTLIKTYPVSALKATFHNSFGYFTPGYIYSKKAMFLIGRQGRIDHLSPQYQFTVNPRTKQLSSYLDKLNKNPIFRFLFAPGLYGLFTIFVGIVLLSKKSKDLLVYFPILFVFIGTLFSAVNAYTRYAFSLYLCFPILLYLLGKNTKNSNCENNKEITKP